MGWRPARIAEALGVTRGAVSQWFKKAIARLRHKATVIQSFFQQARLEPNA
jgi:predicted transcriptional regulator